MDGHSERRSGKGGEPDRENSSGEDENLDQNLADETLAYEEQTETFGDVESPPREGSSTFAATQTFEGDVPTPVDVAPPPASIGPYQIGRLLGEGGFGAVYLAQQDEPVRRPVALKLLKPGVDSPHVLARFESERQAMALLNHDGIAKVYDAGRTPDGRSYFAMEFVEGAPIDKVCDEHRLNVRARLRLFVDACAAVQHAHFKGILHRDLKPSNLLVSIQEGALAPKMIDLGLAKATSGRLSDMDLETVVGMPMGTPEFMSPEQAVNTESGVDVRTDVYSLGVILYQLLTGRLPFDSAKLRSSIMELQRIITEVDPPALATRFQDLSPDQRRQMAEARGTSEEGLKRLLAGDLQWIVARAMDKDVDRRYQGVGELIADVERYLRDEMIVARAPTTSYRLQKFVRRNRVLVSAGSIIFVVLIVALITSTSFWLDAEERRVSLQQRLDRERVNNLVRDADELWPLEPALEPTLVEWIEEVEGILSRRPEHEAALAEATDPKVKAFLAEFLDVLTQQAEDDIHSSTLANVRARLKLLRDLMAHTMDPAMQERWRTAIDEVADVELCPRYEGLRIRPQFGLVPLGRDPKSQLYEFYHVQSGAEPTRDSSGSIVMTEDAGVVLVLIPGGEFLMGARRPDPDDPNDIGPNIETLANSMEGPVEAVTLDPFFLSKFEMTQAQWTRFTGENPSRSRVGKPVRGMNYVCVATQPVEEVSWSLARSVAANLSLVLPTEAQWERAARAGTGTSWYVGSDYERLRGHLNIADASLAKAGSTDPDAHHWPGFEDGYASTAPVGAFLPNGYGLHDIHGNVWEWCRDGETRTYAEVAWREGDGLRVVPKAERWIARGGGYFANRNQCRSARRLFYEYPSEDIGLRPARALTGYGDAKQ